MALSVSNNTAAVDMLLLKFEVTWFIPSYIAMFYYDVPLVLVIQPRHGLHRKHRYQQFCYCVHIRYEKF
jgi:hypothetical protein